MKLPKIRNLSSTRYLAHRVLTRFLAKELDGRKFGLVLDIGAGKGPYRKFLECEKYVLLDVENRSGNSDTIIANLNEKVPLADNSVDCVLCTEVLEHIKQPQHAVNEIYRILNKDGVLVLTTPAAWPLHEVPNDFFRYTRYGIEHLLKEAGFETIKIKPSNSYPYTIAQLAVIYLRPKIYTPIVILINLLGILSNKFSKNYDMPLGNHVRAYKI